MRRRRGRSAGDPGPNYKGPCWPLGRSAFILSEMGSLCRIWAEECHDPFYVLEETVWLVENRPQGDQERQ